MKRIQLDSGFVYDYTNMMLPGGVTEADVTNLGPAISDALAAAIVHLEDGECHKALKAKGIIK